MTYLRNFLAFWKNFILGDDKRIAIAIMWICLITYAWTHELFNIWYFSPLAVLALVTTLLYVDTNPRATLATALRNRMTSPYILVAPMLLCIVVPQVLFRFMNGDLTSQHVLVPVVILVGATLVYAFVAKRFLSRYPSLVSFVSGLATYVAVTYVQPPLNRLSTMLVQDFPGAVEFVAIIAICIYVVYRLRIKSAS